MTTTNNTNKRWTATDEQLLIELVNRGQTVDFIAEMLGRTEKAVSGKAHSLRADDPSIKRLKHRTHKLVGDAHLQQELPFVVHEPAPKQSPVFRMADSIESEVDKTYVSDYIPYALYFGFGFVAGALTIITFGG